MVKYEEIFPFLVTLPMMNIQPTLSACEVRMISFASTCVIVIFFLPTICKSVIGNDELDFAHDVVPVLRKNCVKCHANGNYKGGFSLDTRSAVLKSGNVELKKPAESEIIERVLSEDHDFRMPPDGPKLTEKEVDVLTKWINSDLKWEEGFTFKINTWKAPIAPRRPEIPDGPGNPIDKIIGEYFSDQSIDWPADSSDSVFIRRVMLDLLGVLPATGELQSFLGDSDPHKRTKLVAEILSLEKEYAVHWLTFWNDHLRNDYVGTGFIDGGRKQVTKWLYQSLLDNKPYDQFARELISPSADSDGFIRGIKWRGNVNASQVREVQFAQNISQVFLGENLKCASCHDSFINDWKLTDAYGLAAVIAEKPIEMFRCDVPTGQMAETKFLWPELGSIDPNKSKNERLAQTANLITKPENGRFTRTIVNRLWKRMMGRGLVEPVDIMGNRPWNEDLLDFLAIHLSDNGYDLKKTMALIANSKIYQAKTVSMSTPADEEYTFTGPIARRMTAEQFLDSVHALTGTEPKGNSKVPDLKPKKNATQDAPRGRKAGANGASPSGLASHWIWSRADSSDAKPKEKLTFATNLILDKKAKSAFAIVTCDNEYTLSVNGKRLGGDADWTTVEMIDLTAQLQVGKNQIDIFAKNLGSTPNPASLYVSIFVDKVFQKTVWFDSVYSKPAVKLTNQDLWGSVGSKIMQLEERANNGLRKRSLRAALVISDPLMRSLGRPNREQIVTTRDDQLSTLQALDLSNGEILSELLSTGARRLVASGMDRKKLIDHVFSWGLSRLPSGDERQVVEQIVDEKMTTESIADLLWSIIMLPEFQHVR